MHTRQVFHALSVALTVIGFNAALSVATPTKDPAPFKDEKPGQTFNNGVPVGTLKNISGIETYLSYPPGKHGQKKTDTAILYLSDIFGLPLVNNKLLADSFASAGYFVVEPDLFDGEPVPVAEFGSPTWNMTAWRERHPQARIEEIVETSLKSIKEKFGVKKLGAVGYCFGGKYVTRFLTPGTGIDAGFTAHPSGVLDDEYAAISVPLSIAFGELDGSNTPVQRASAEAVFTTQNKTFQTTLYSNAEHGFAVRTNLTDSEKRFAQESAYFQAVRWFDFWIKG